MKRKFLFVLAAMMISLSAITSTAFAGFRDVDANQYAWAKESIDFMIDRNIVNGYPDGTFQPGKEVTKAEFTVMVYRLFPNLRAAEPEEIPGVPSDHWASKEFSELYSTIWPIYAADEQNFQDETYTYSPDHKMTRWDVLIVLDALFSGLQKEEVDTPQLFRILADIRDVEKRPFSSYAQYETWNQANNLLAPAIGFLQEKGEDPEITGDLEWSKANALYTFQTLGIMTTDNQGSFRPLNRVTRAEIVTILHRLVAIAGQDYAPVQPEPDPITSGTRHYLYGPGESIGSGHNLFYSSIDDFAVVLGKSMVDDQPIKTVTLRVESSQIVDVNVTVNGQTTLYPYEQLTDPLKKVSISVEGVPFIIIESKARFPEQLKEDGSNEAMIIVES